MLEITENTLAMLFKGDFSKITSLIYRIFYRMTDREFIYGEIDFLSFQNILEKAEPQPGEIFYDLGSGTGKAVFSAALFFDLSRSCGIELLLPLHNKASNKIKKANQLFQNIKTDLKSRYLKQVSSIQFINDSFLNHDFNDANIVYVAATCFTQPIWERLIHKMATLKSGSRIIIATKSIHHERFEIIYQGIELMSWGLCPVKIYRIK